MFNQTAAEQKLNEMLKWYGIKVEGWSSASCGRAYWKRKSVKIPKPTNPDRFGVCMHEIKHIIDGNKGKRYEQEFACDMFARNQMINLGMDVTEWDVRTNWHILSRIAMAHNRKANLSKLKPEIKLWFQSVDFTKWIGKKVFVRYQKTAPGYTIEYSVNLNKWEVEMLLNRKGLMIEKSESDDSTYGNWIVKSNQQPYGSEFSNLSEVVNHYQLAI